MSYLKKAKSNSPKPPPTFTSLAGLSFPSRIEAQIDDGYYQHAIVLAAKSGPWGYGAGEAVVMALYRLLKKGLIEPLNTSNPYD
jgi:hypothetical protein